MWQVQADQSISTLSFRDGPEKRIHIGFADVFNMNSQSEVIFNSVGIEFKNKQLDIRDATGSFLIGESTTTDNFRLSA